MTTSTFPMLPGFSDLIEMDDVMIEMRDGAKLRADVFTPSGTGPFPTLVHRYPYTPGDGTMNFFARVIATQGYAVVVQSTRGRFGSEGTFVPFQSDIEDGHDTVEWAAAQPWSNGKVGMYGSSYAGVTQWLAALARPEHLVCSAPAVAPWDLTSGAFYHSPGILNLGLAVAWSAQMTVEEAESRNAEPPLQVFADSTRLVESGGLGDEAMRARLFGMQAAAAPPLYGHRPLRDIPEFRDFAAWFSDWADNPSSTDTYWQRINAAARASEITMPVLHVAGWHDYFVLGGLDAFSDLTRHAGDCVAAQQRLVVGPWNHNTSQTRPDPGADAGLFFDFSPQGPTMRFFAHHLKGELPAYSDEPAVRIYVMGENVWRDEHEWPLARTNWTPLHLRSSGALSSEVPTDESADQFTYDPANPVPGPLAIGGTYDDAVDLNVVALRDDVLVYTTEAFEHDVEVTGPVTVELWAASDAPSTDFTASLVEVFANGTVVPLCQGIIRTAQNGIPTVAGVAYRHEIDLVAISVLVRAGHKLRLDISSSIYPTYELNPNTGKRTTDDAELVMAHQTVFHDAMHPSRVILPIVPLA